MFSMKVANADAKIKAHFESFWSQNPLMIFTCFVVYVYVVYFTSGWVLRTPNAGINILLLRYLHACK